MSEIDETIEVDFDEKPKPKKGTAKAKPVEPALMPHYAQAIGKR